MKKRNQKICDMNTQSKILCAKFGSYSKQIFASGDDKNSVQIWMIGNTKPIATFSQQTTSSAPVEVTTVQFSFTETELFSGSNRGIINVWDVEAQKQLQTLKGHIAAVQSLCIYPSDENKNLLFSGAYDTIIKLWDLRSRQIVSQFKGHGMQINCLAVSPDSKMLASGSHDGLVKVWDIGTQKLLTNFNQHDAPVGCLQFNPVDKALASGGGDRCVKYWDLDKFSMIASTRTDSTPIQSILFEPNGKYIFSAAHESLKIWDLEKDGMLLDNVESTWRGVQDMAVVQERDQLVGLAVSPQQGFGLFGVSLKSINIDAKQTEVRTSGGRNSAVRGRTPEVRTQAQTAKPAVESESRLKSKPSFQLQAQNILNQDYQYQIDKSPIDQQQQQSQQQQQQQQQLLQQQQQFLMQQQQQQMPQQYQQYVTQQPQYQQQQQALYQQIPVNQIQLNQLQQQQYQFQQQPNNIQQYQIPQIKSPPSIKQFVPSQPVQQLNQNDSIPVLDEEFKSDPLEQQSNLELMTSHDELNLSQFMLGDNNKEKFKQVDLINEISKDHNKVNQILKQRMNYMKPILHWWCNGNIKSAINAINQQQLTEPSILLDALTMCYSTAKFAQIPLDVVPSLVEKARILIDSRYMSHIRGGLEFVYRVFCQFKDEILSIKCFNQMSKVDLAREERVSKCDKLIEQLKIIVQMPKMQKLIDRNKEDVTDLAKKLQIEVVGFLKKANHLQS